MIMEPLNPCPHMTTWLSALVDDALPGLLRRYAHWHLAHCPRCRAALAALRALRDQLRALVSAPPATLSPARWQIIESAWAEADAGQT